MALVTRIFDKTRASPDDIHAVIPADDWSVTPDPDPPGPGQHLILRGAVLVRFGGAVPQAVEAEAPLSNEPGAALSEPRARPLLLVWQLLRQDGIGAPLALLAALSLAVLVTLGEILLFRGLLDIGAALKLPDQRLAAALLLLVFLAAGLVLRYPLTTETMRPGRRLETRLRMALATRLVTLPDRYLQSRPASDMADRAHSLHLTRALPGMGLHLVQLVFERGLIVAGIAVAAPGSLGAALALALAACLLPALMQPALAEADLAWTVAGVAGLMPAFVSGAAGPVGLGGGFPPSPGGLSALARAGVAWTAVGPIFRPGAGSVRPGRVPVPGAPEGGRVLVGAARIGFRHAGQARPVPDDLTLSIREGERILLEGASGSGKSTLAALLTGLREPGSGSLLLAGLDRATLGEGWHDLATSAPQFDENHILSGPLAMNLLLGRTWPARPEDLREAQAICEDLGLGPLIDRMPGGLSQIVGETGWQLSHGEKSRIFLVRALLQGAPLTAIDESFAAPGPESQALCLACIERRARTLVVVAHP